MDETNNSDLRQFDPSLSREDVLSLPGSERIAWVEHLQVEYPRLNEIMKQFRLCYRMAKVAAEPPCRLLVGPAGVGKTTAVASFAQEHPPVYTATSIHRPILMATILVPATVKSLATVLLEALGDPLADRGTTANMTLRIKAYIRDCGVRMLILDELQHFVDRDSQVILQNVSDWLKIIIKETGVACVLVGLVGEAEQVVNFNPQLRSLFGRARVLMPFQWDEEKPETIAEFRRLLSEIEALLPLKEPSNLWNKETAWRCFAASRGVFRPLMSIIREAAELCLREGKEYIDPSLLARAFPESLAYTGVGMANPFLGDPPSSALPDLDAEIKSGRIAAATNRRSKARKAPPTGLEHVLG